MERERETTMNLNKGFTDTSGGGKAYLILADGEIYEGESIGASGETVGEIVFTTSMGGYMETISDPSYYGQIVMQTFPLIGNYGSIEADAESVMPRLSGYIVRSLCEDGSNFRKDGELGDYLAKNNIVGISGLDTRHLTRKIREKGVMNGMITTDKKDVEAKLKTIKQFKIKDAVANTSVKETTVYNENGKYKIVLWDFGAKANIDRELIARDACVVRVPYDITADEILKIKPDGIMLSNGAGDPAENKTVIEELKKLFPHRIPMFGICLGHQLLALANGASTNKLKYGHRGSNQPVKDLKRGKAFITSQNHGYAVVSKSLDPAVGAIRFSNVNDRTCEGIDYQNIPAFSVQFHPEACGGPQDTEFLFDTFLSIVEKNKR